MLNFVLLLSFSLFWVCLYTICINISTNDTVHSVSFQKAAITPYYKKTAIPIQGSVIVKQADQWVHHVAIILSSRHCVSRFLLPSLLERARLGTLDLANISLYSLPSSFIVMRLACAVLRCVFFTVFPFNVVFSLPLLS